jgi:LPXTG-motif cell wall-anchored protein
VLPPTESSSAVLPPADSSGPSAPTADDQSSGVLPNTGGVPVGLLGLAGVAIAAGGGLILFGRRRTS